MKQRKSIRYTKGFTLVELLIVVLVIGMIYSVAFSKMKFVKPQPKALTPLNLKETILSSKTKGKHLTLLCITDCQKCFLRSDVASAYQPYNNSIDLKDIKAYTVDARNTLMRIDYERYKDQKVCLKIDFYPNGSSTPIILQDAESTYFLPAYFEEAKRFSDPSDAKDYWLENTQLVSDNGDFY